MLRLPTLHGHACDPSGQATDSMPLLPPRRPLWPRPSAKALANPIGHICGHENQHSSESLKNVQRFNHQASKATQVRNQKDTSKNSRQAHTAKAFCSAHWLKRCVSKRQSTKDISRSMCMYQGHSWAKFWGHSYYLNCAVSESRAPANSRFNDFEMVFERNLEYKIYKMAMKLIVQVFSLHGCSALSKSARFKAGTKIWFQPMFCFAWTSRFLRLHSSIAP